LSNANTLSSSADFAQSNTDASAYVDIVATKQQLAASDAQTFGYQAIELRASLDSIIGCSKILHGVGGDKLQTAEQQKCIAHIHEAALQLESVLHKNRFGLEPASLDQNVIKEQFDILEVLDDLLLDNTEGAKLDSLSFDLEVSKTPTLVDADKKLFSQAIVMLLSSLQKMSVSGTPILVRTGKFAGKVTITASRSGVILPKSLTAHINSDFAHQTLPHVEELSDVLTAIMTAKHMHELNHGTVKAMMIRDNEFGLTVKLPAATKSTIQRPFNPVNDIIDLNACKLNKLDNSISIEDTIFECKTG